MSRKYNYYSAKFYEPTRPIETREGIKARSQQGGFAKNWWATRWIAALERLVDSGRLTRGRSYARRGQVLSIEETGAGIEARVQGSRPKPYRVTIQVSPLSDAAWERVTEHLAGQAIFSAQLLSGEMPPEIEEVFQAAGVSLFPAQTGDLTTECSCPDWANPCKHVAATHYILAERFDEDPFLLFRLRGRTQEQILVELRRARAGLDEPEEEEEEIPETIPALEDSLERFWDLGESLDDFSISIHPPAVELPLLKRLGDPDFIPDPGLTTLLGPAYWAISQTALEVALIDEELPGEE